MTHAPNFFKLDFPTKISGKVPLGFNGDFLLSLYCADLSKQAGIQNFTITIDPYVPPVKDPNFKVDPIIVG